LKQSGLKRAIMGRLGRINHLVAAVMASLGVLSASAFAVKCTQSGIQAISPANTTIVSATLQSDSGQCDVIGHVTTADPGPNEVNFELMLPLETNGRFLFIGNGGFAGGLGFPEVFPDYFQA
jgi:hypothetical protein